MENEEINRQIAFAYTKVTVDAALFAQRMGKADADAVLVGTLPEVPNSGKLRLNWNSTIESLKMNSSTPSLCCESIVAREPASVGENQFRQ